MKPHSFPYRIFYVLGVFYALLFSFARSAVAQNAGAKPTAPRKLALLVGISNYARGRDAEQDWWNLHCQEDIVAMKQVLKDRFGFADSDILVLTDAKATRQGIIEAFKNQLVARAHPGDVVLFHYSGHGQQVPDPSHRKLNGMHQGFVPFDYISQRASDGLKSNLLDDQMRDLLGQLKAKMQGPDGKVQGNITVFLDSCFSGTATRSVSTLPHRGRGWNEKIDGPRPQASTANVTQETPSGSGLLDRGEATAKGYVVISATRSDQTAQEAKDEKDRPMGALTYYLTRALQQATPQTTYRALFEKVSLQVQDAVSNQNPQLEGDADKLLFAGTALPVQSYVVVQKPQKNTLALPIGLLQGASVGSRYALYRAGSDVSDPKNLVAEAEIKSLADLTAQAQLTPEYADKVDAKDLLAARAVETSHNFGENRLKVRLEGQGTWLEAVKAAQARGDLDVMTTEGTTADNYDVLIRPANDGKLSVLRRGEQPLALIANDEGATSKIRDALVGEWRWRYLARLGSAVSPGSNSLLQVEMRLVKVGAPEGASTSQPEQLVFRYGDSYALQLRNLSPVDAYVTVLDLSPDGTINPVLPPGDVASSELNRIPADKHWHLIKGFSWAASAPAGREIWKAIATREPADFRSLLLQKIPNDQGELLYPPLVDINKRGAPPNPLERVLLRSQTATRRGFTAVPPSYWATTQVTFVVEP